METAISQPTRSLSVGPRAYPGGMHGAALPKPILPHPLYGIYTLPRVSAASLFTEAHICTPTAAQPALTPPSLFLHSSQRGAVKWNMPTVGKEILQINPEQKMTPWLKWTVSFASMRLLLPLFLSSRFLWAEFSSIPGYSHTAGICRCWFTASEDTHICPLLFLRKVTSGWK